MLNDDRSHEEIIWFHKKHLLLLKDKLETRYGTFPELKLINTRLSLLNNIRFTSPYIDNLIERHTEPNFNFESIEYWKKRLNHFLSVSDQTICAAIITLNEERCIQRCIDSIVDKVDEIVIIDTGSTDNTIELAKSYHLDKIKIYNYKWNDSFADARNYALEHVKSDWVFYIDADEYLNGEENEVKSLINLFNHFPFKNSLVLSPSITNHNEHNLLDVRRIFSTASGIKFYGSVHEEPRKDINQFGEDVYSISVDIKVGHDGYLPEVVDKKEKLQRNISLLKKMIISEPENPRWKFFLVRDGFMVLDPGEIEVIIKETISVYPQKELQLSNLKGHDYIFSLLNLLIELKFLQGKFKEVEKMSEMLNELEPKNSNSIYFSTISRIFTYKNDMYEMLNRTIKYREENFEVQHGMLHSHGYHIDFLLGLLLFETGRYKQAFTYFDFLQDKFIDQNIMQNYQSLQRLIEERQI